MPNNEDDNQKPNSNDNKKDGSDDRVNYENVYELENNQVNAKEETDQEENESDKKTYDYKKPEKKDENKIQEQHETDNDYQNQYQTNYEQKGQPQQQISQENVNNQNVQETYTTESESHTERIQTDNQRETYPQYDTPSPQYNQNPQEGQSGSQKDSSNVNTDSNVQNIVNQNQDNYKQNGTNEKKDNIKSDETKSISDTSPQNVQEIQRQDVQTSSENKAVNEPGSKVINTSSPKIEGNNSLSDKNTKGNKNKKGDVESKVGISKSNTVNLKENTSLESKAIKSGLGKSKTMRKDKNKTKEKGKNEKGKKAPGIKNTSSSSKDEKGSESSSTFGSVVNAVGTMEGLLKKNKDGQVNVAENAANMAKSKMISLAKVKVEGTVKKFVGKVASKKLSTFGKVVNAFSKVKDGDAKGLITDLASEGLNQVIRNNPYSWVVLLVIAVAIVIFAIFTGMQAVEEHEKKKEQSSYNYVEPVKSLEGSETKVKFENNESSGGNEVENEFYDRIKAINNAYIKLDDYFFSTNNPAKLETGFASEVKKSKNLFVNMFKNMIVQKEKIYDFSLDGRLFDYLYDYERTSEIKIFLENDLKNVDGFVYSSDLMDNYSVEEKLSKYKEILVSVIDDARKEIEASSDDENGDGTKAELDKSLIKKRFLDKISGNSEIVVPYYKKVFVGVSDDQILEKVHVSTPSFAKSKSELYDLMFMLYFVDNLGFNQPGNPDAVFKVNLKDDELKSIANTLMSFKVDISWHEGSSGELKTLNYIFDNSKVDSENEMSVLLIKKMKQTLEDNVYKSFISFFDDNIGDYDPEDCDPEEDQIEKSLFKTIHFIRSKVEKLTDKEISNRDAYQMLRKNDNGELEFYRNPLPLVISSLISQLKNISGTYWSDHYMPVKAVDDKDYKHVVKNLLPGVTEEIDFTEVDKVAEFLLLYTTKAEILNGLKTIEEFGIDVKTKLETAMERNDLVLKEIIESAKSEAAGEVDDDNNGVLRFSSGTTLENMSIDDNKIKKQIINNEVYFLVDDTVDLEKIDIEHLPLNFKNWFENSYFRKKVLENPIYNFCSPNTTNQEDKNLDKYSSLKKLKFENINFIYPALNHVWVDNQSSGYGIDYNGDKEVYNGFMELKFDSPENIYSVYPRPGVVLDKGERSLKVQYDFIGDKDKNDAVNFYVEYDGLIPSNDLEIGSKIFRYDIPYDKDSYNEKEVSTIIGKADENQTLKIKCYFSPYNDDEESLIVRNYHLIIGMNDDLVIDPYPFMIGYNKPLPKKDYVPPVPSPSEESKVTPSASPSGEPSSPYNPYQPDPTVMPEPSPIGNVLHRNLLIIFAEITRVAGMLFAIWSIIKFALGLHDYESANYQAIWQFVAASILIFGAMILKRIAGL